MARPPTFTPEEDQIILETAGQDTVITNRLLAQRGYKQRNATSIISRRRYLVRTGQGAVGRTRLVSLLAQREKVKARFEESRRELDKLNTEVRKEMASVEHDLDVTDEAIASSGDGVSS